MPSVLTLLNGFIFVVVMFTNMQVGFCVECSGENKQLDEKCVISKIYIRPYNISAMLFVVQTENDSRSGYPRFTNEV